MPEKEETLARSGSENPFIEKFQAFFESQYKKEIERLVGSYPEKRSLNVDFGLLQQFDYQLADELIESPDYLLEAAEQALESVDIPALEVKEFRPHVRFFNLPKDREKLIRDIGSEDLGKLIAVEGVVRQITDVLPKLMVAVWKCRRCGNIYRIEQKTQEISMPNFCECKHRDFELQQDQSTFIDFQKIQIQEPLEKLKGNEQAVYLDIYVSDDQVNKVGAGDKTRFVGTLRLYPAQQKKIVYGRFLASMHMEETEREFEEVEVTPEEEKEIQKLAKNPKIYEMLTGSIAPAIYGHEVVKESIILQLFGGVKKVLPGNQVIRGNAHVLLVGDPGCLVADERIVLGNGAIERMGDLGQEHLEEINVQVLTGQGGAKRDRATVFHYYKSQPVIEIITETGKSIRGTANHPLMQVSKEDGCLKRQWTRLDEFREGDQVAVVAGIPCGIEGFVETGFKPIKYTSGPKPKGSLPEKLTPELAAFLGYMTGDGRVRKYETAFVVADGEKDILKPLIQMAEGLFSIKPRIVRRKLPGRTVWLNYASIYSNNIAQNLMFLKEKRIPKIVMRSGNKVAASFLKWLYEADGCAFCKGRGRRAISFKAKNIELLRDMQVLLLRFGIHSRIVKRALQIRRGRDIIKFAENIGFASKKKRQRLEKLKKEARKFKRFGQQRSERIVKIIKHKPEDVFDIEVPNSHRFIANGVVSHNTGKSQILQAANNIAPKSIYTAGKTTSGVGLCVAPDSLILNDNGFKRIGNFVEENFCSEKAVEEIPNAWANDFCGKSHSLNQQLKVEEGRISKIWRIKAPPEMIEIETRLGKKLELTPNTSIIRIKENKIEWTQAKDAMPGDFIACCRKLPEGERKNIPTISVLASDKNIKVKDNVSALLKEMTNRLVQNYGTLQKIAKRMGKSRDTLYAIRNKKFYHAISLKNFVEMGKEAGFDEGVVSGHISEIFISHGKEMKLPRYLDDEEIAYLAGLVLGDGNLCERGNSSSIRFFSASEQLLHRFDRIVSEKFGLAAEKINDGIRVPARRVKFRAVCDILKAFGLHKDKTKIKISHLASEMPNNVLAKLLQGLFDTDGYVVAGESYSASIGLTTISEELARSTQLGLLKFGIQSKLRKKKKAGQLAVGRKISVRSKHDQYCIEIRGKGNIDLFKESIGFSLERKKGKLQKLVSAAKGNTNIDVIPQIKTLLKEENAEWVYSSGRSNISREKLQKMSNNNSINSSFLKQLAKSDIMWEQITTKRSFKPEYPFVYDFSVEKNHNFIANGIFAHNTASAVKDDFGEGGWTLKAGALVLSSGGVCMADELDKMDNDDRYALHEAMEQGMVSVAKAGIVTRFKAETSILAAANPKFSRFDQYTPFIEQVNLPPTLVSRFDLFFMIKDVLDKTKDEAISEHILRTHRSGELLSQHKRKGRVLKKQELEEIESISAPKITQDILRKYISYARQNIFPVLSKEAIQAIGDFYIGLRDMGRKEGSYAATHRQLEGLVRLSEASARVRLSDIVEKQDAERAIRLVKASLSDVVTDPETGKIDYDIIATGVTHTQITNMKRIIDIVKAKAREMDAVPVQDVLAEAETEGISKEKARDLISKLEKKGELYRPRHDLLKPTQKE
ncbi:MAG: ATP-binding protein [Candidatus Diapherotrites archaeon]|uniref:DNA helicase n=1 Tax=Candidatus Iainarchaeum sp. TaxID=3101447 RepID=A0A938YX73_9ARCH|nr:ATP-binding protein [Candidatus Diapherotrites archaeon]